MKRDYRYVWTPEGNKEAVKNLQVLRDICARRVESMNKRLLEVERYKKENFGGTGSDEKRKQERIEKGKLKKKMKRNKERKKKKNKRNREMRENE